MRSPSNPAAFVAGSQYRLRHEARRTGPPLGASHTYSPVLGESRSSLSATPGSVTVRTLALVLHRSVMSKPPTSTRFSEILSCPVFRSTLSHLSPSISDTLRPP